MAKASAGFIPQALTRRITPTRQPASKTIKSRTRTSIPDPIFAAIDKHRKLLETYDRLVAAIDRAEHAIHKQIYKHARQRAAIRHDLTLLRQQFRRIRRTEQAASMRMAKMKPKTTAGAAALVAYTRADMEMGWGPKWHLIALATIATALTVMDTT